MFTNHPENTKPVEYSDLKEVVYLNSTENERTLWSEQGLAIFVQAPKLT